MSCYNYIFLKETDYYFASHNYTDNTSYIVGIHTNVIGSFTPLSGLVPYHSHACRK